jgi:hypothetical protein
MSDIKRYKMEFAPGSGGWIKQTARGELVLFTDHEAAIEKLNVEIAGKGREIARLDAALAEKQQVLADAKARIEGIPNEYGLPPHTEYADGVAREAFRHGINAALAALTQPQTEIEGKPDGTWYDIPDGGGAATAAGVADADLVAAAMEISVKATRLDPETYKVPDKLIWMLRSALFPNEDMERIKSPGPYAKAFREKFPVPEFPGIKNGKKDA